MGAKENLASGARLAQIVNAGEVLSTKYCEKYKEESQIMMDFW